MTQAIPKNTVSGFYRWIVIGVWGLCSSAAWGVVLVIGLLLPAIGLDLNLTSTQQGLLASIPFWGSVVLTIPCSIWFSRYRPALLTSITLVFGTIFLFGQALASIFVVILGFRLLFGLAMVAREPARPTLIRQRFSPREYVAVNGLIAGILCLTIATVMVATPHVLSSLGGDWRGTLTILGSAFAFLTILWILLGRDGSEFHSKFGESPVEPISVKNVTRHKDLWLAGFGFVGATMAWSAFVTFYPTFMLDKFLLPVGHSGLILAFSMVCSGVVSLVIGYVATTPKRRSSILKIGGILIAGSQILLLTTDSLPVLLVIAAVNGIGMGLYPILLTVPFQLPAIGARELSVAHSIIMTSLSLGMALGPIAIGLLQEPLGGLGTTLVFVSLTALAVVLSGFLLHSSSAIDSS